MHYACTLWSARPNRWANLTTSCHAESVFMRIKTTHFASESDAAESAADGWKSKKQRQIRPKCVDWYGVCVCVGMCVIMLNDYFMSELICIDYYWWLGRSAILLFTGWWSHTTINRASLAIRASLCPSSCSLNTYSISRKKTPTHSYIVWMVI